MQTNKEMLLEAMARAQCKAAGTGSSPACLQCFGNSSDCMWKTFLPEAEAVLEAMKQFAVVKMRVSPRKE